MNDDDDKYVLASQWTDSQGIVHTLKVRRKSKSPERVVIFEEKSPEAHQLEEKGAERRQSVLGTIDENGASWSTDSDPFAGSATTTTTTPTTPTYAEFYLKLKRSGSLALPVGEYTEAQKKELLDLFNMFDLNKDKKLSKDDLLRIFRALSPRYTEEMVAAFIKSATNSEADEMTFEQFKNFIGGTFFGKFSRLELRYVFDCLDKDGDGFINAGDLRAAFSELGWHHDVDKIVRQMDRQARGKICFEDFKNCMNDLE